MWKLKLSGILLVMGVLVEMLNMLLTNKQVHKFNRQNHDRGRSSRST